MAEQVRTFRDSAGLSVPSEDRQLMESSASRAWRLNQEGRLAHQDARGRGVALQLLAQGYPAGEFGEILGAGPALPEVWKAWLASPSHRAVLETPGWKRWGWGSSLKGKSTIWVVRFWRP